MTSKETSSPYDLEPTTSTCIGELEDQTLHDAVFGDVSKGGPNYRAVRMLQKDLYLFMLS